MEDSAMLASKKKRLKAKQSGLAVAGWRGGDVLEEEKAKKPLSITKKKKKKQRSTWL
jgi:hypothetical protein